MIKQEHGIYFDSNEYATSLNKLKKNRKQKKYTSEQWGRCIIGCPSSYSCEIKKKCFSVHITIIGQLSEARKRGNPNEHPDAEN